MLNNKIIIIGNDKIECLGDVNANQLHYFCLMNYIKEKYPNDYINITSLQSAIYFLIAQGNIILLNMIQGIKNSGNLFLPNEYNDYQLSKLINLANYFNSYYIHISYNLSLLGEEIKGVEELYLACGNLKEQLIKIFLEIEALNILKDKNVLNRLKN